jgi:DNA (cytosine-5)-methyltransferase 1
MQRAVDAWGGETFHGIASRPHTPVRQKLSDMLECDADPKYLLSARACIGILRRAGVRGKKLPELLRIALEAQARLGGDIAEVTGDVLRSAGFCTEHSARARGVGYEDEKSPTLRAGSVPAAVVYDARGNGDGETVCTITGDHNGHISDYTALAVMPKAYGICSYMSHSMQSANPTSGYYDADTSRTLGSDCCRPDSHQGGVAVVTEARRPVCYQDNVGTLCASDYKFPQQQQIHESKAIVEQAEITGSYTVRRLTPKECLALMNLPTDWCDGLGTAEPTEEDISFWSEVWETHRRVIGTSTKPKSRKQIEKWLRNPYSDSACYKMAGNGICVSIAVMLFKGIKEYENRRLAENNTT